MFADKVLLITGGTGSFGNAVLKRFLDSSVREIRIFSRDEKKQDDMRNYYNNSKIKYFIGDVRDKKSVSGAARDVDYVFSCGCIEAGSVVRILPLEALKTNALGTENVLSAAIEHGISKVICLSTDKAVYPINAMGISKAMMEKIAVSKSRISGNTQIMITRYGNVMASRGSVIPLFVSQIKAKQPITITHGAMTRFIMSLEEAVNLVMFAFANGSGGDIFVQKSPAASLILLASCLKELFKSDSEIRTIGVRHGEKLYETLLTREERGKSKDLGDYFRVVPDIRDLNYGKYYSIGNDHAVSSEDYTSENTKQLTMDELRLILLGLPFIKEELENYGNL